MAKTPQPRKEATSVRLEPKIKYLIEFAARIQRRSVTNYIEWALEESLKNVHINDNITGFVGNVSLEYLKDSLWDIDEAKRFIILASCYPDLLTFEEQKLWDIIMNQPFLYLLHKQNMGWVAENINFEKLENDWDLLVKASYNDEEALMQIKKKHSEVLSKRNKKYDDMVSKIEVFKNTLSTPKTKEDYEKQNNELQQFLDDLQNEYTE